MRMITTRKTTPRNAFRHPLSAGANPEVVSAKGGRCLNHYYPPDWRKGAGDRKTTVARKSAVVADIGAQGRETTRPAGIVKLEEILGFSLRLAELGNDFVEEIV